MNKKRSARRNNRKILEDNRLKPSSTPQEHNSRLLAVLQRLQPANVTLNHTKCEFNQKSVKLLGHLVDSQGIRADPEKIAAVPIRL